VNAVWSLLEPRPYQAHCLRTFWSMLIPWPNIVLGLYVLSTCVVLGLTFACWKLGESVPLALRYSVLLLASVLIAPHLTVYDLVMLAAALPLASGWLIGETSDWRRRRLGTLLCLVYVLPLLGPLAKLTHVQLSVIAMATTVCGISTWARQIAGRAVK